MADEPMPLSERMMDHALDIRDDFTASLLIQGAATIERLQAEAEFLREQFSDEELADLVGDAENLYSEGLGPSRTLALLLQDAGAEVPDWLKPALTYWMANR